MGKRKGYIKRREYELGNPQTKKCKGEIQIVCREQKTTRDGFTAWKCNMQHNKGPIRNQGTEGERGGGSPGGGERKLKNSQLVLFKVSATRDS